MNPVFPVDLAAARDLRKVFALHVHDVVTVAGVHQEVEALDRALSVGGAADLVNRMGETELAESGGDAGAAGADELGLAGDGGIEISEDGGEVVVEGGEIVAHGGEGLEEVGVPEVGTDGFEPGVGGGVGGVEDAVVEAAADPFDVFDDGVDDWRLARASVALRIRPRGSRSSGMSANSRRRSSAKAARIWR